MTGLLPILFSLLSLVLGHDEAELVFAGDAMMHKAQIETAHRGNGFYDFAGYFDSISPYIISADYAVVNLETPVAGAPYSGYPCFNAPSQFVDALRRAGFDLFLTANNHTLDRGDRGLRATIDSLDARRLHHIGTYHDAEARSKQIPFIRNINGIRVGFLNYTYGTNGITPRGNVVVDYINRERIRADVDSTRRAGADIIVACMHWGDEYCLLPVNSEKEMARYLQSLGVEVIIGGHPHVIQPMEMTQSADGRNRLLVYSLGNFISNMKTRDTRGGAVVRLRLRRDENGRVNVTDACYRLVYTEQPPYAANFRLRWVDESSAPGASAFATSARGIFNKHNVNVPEGKSTVLME